MANMTAASQPDPRALAPDSGSAHLLEYARILRAARQAAGLSLRELATRAGTSHSTLVAYESGAKVPSVNTFLRVLHACEFAVDLLLNRRVRWRNGLARGDELAQVLELAEHFPNRYARRKTPLDFPRFGAAPCV